MTLKHLAQETLDLVEAGEYQAGRSDCEVCRAARVGRPWHTSLQTR